MTERTLALFLAFALQDPPPAPPAPPVVDSVDVEEASRAERLKADRVRYETLVEAIEEFGHEEEFAAKSKELLDAATDRFVRVSDGSVTDASLANWLVWNVPKEPGGRIPALDVESAPAGHPYDAIVDMNRQLRARGVDFLLVTLPSRPQIYPELFMELSPPATWDGFAGFCGGTARFALALNAAGVEVLYLAPEFVAQRFGADGDAKDQLFLRDNQHWTPRAAEIAAKAVAERLAKYPWFKRGAAKETVDFVVKEREMSVGIIWSRAPEWAKPEKLKASQVVQLRGVTSLRPSSPITLLSGSFADFHQSNGCDFTTQLYRFSGWPIDKINPRGGVEEKCREELAESRGDAIRFGKKDLVIWLLAEQAFRPGPAWGLVPICRD